MEELDSALLRKLYSDTIIGHTIARYKNNNVFIKHFSTVDQGIIDQNYATYFDLAKLQGLPTREEKLVQLKESALWSDKDDAWIESQKYYIENLQKTKAKLPWLSDVEAMNVKIKEEEKRLSEKIFERNELIDLVAEIYASKKVNECYINYSFFKDSELSVPLFSEEDFSDLSSVELSELVFIYNTSLNDFNVDNLKRIGLSRFFQNIYGLCENNVLTFFGKPVCRLTYYQTEIFSYGRFFHNILNGETKPDSTIAKDPDKLIDWYSSSKNSSDLIKKQQETVEGEASTMIFGAKSSDLKAAGIQALGDDPITAARKAGRSLTGKDLIKA